MVWNAPNQKGQKKDFAVVNVICFLNNNSDPALFPARGTSDQVLQHQGGIGALMWRSALWGEQGKDTHSFCLHNLVNETVWGIAGSILHMSQSQGAPLNTTKVAQQKFGVSCQRQPPNNLTFPPVDFWRQGRDADSQKCQFSLTF